VRPPNGALDLRCLESRLERDKNLDAVPVRPISSVFAVPVVMMPVMMMPMTMMPVATVGFCLRAWRRGQNRSNECESQQHYFHFLKSSQSDCHADVFAEQARNRHSRFQRGVAFCEFLQISFSHVAGEGLAPDRPLSAVYLGITASVMVEEMSGTRLALPMVKFGNLIKLIPRLCKT
jgi:hypothetical protein